MSGDEALLELLGQLKARAYDFVAVTPATHSRVLARPAPKRLSLRDIFGWNRPFAEQDVEPELLELLRHADCLREANGSFQSRIRVAGLDGELFLHTAFPTDAVDAVFFGPDTYRFARSVAAHLSSMRTHSWLVDMGAGSGAGAITCAKRFAPSRVTMVDLNPLAARFAALNAAFAGVSAECMLSDHIPAGCDLVIANPPYMIDSAHRTYRDGGSSFGGEVACAWVAQALDALVPGGSLILYSGAAVIDGKAPLIERVHSLCSEARAALHVEEIDPDVFGEELEGPHYESVERIAALLLKITTQ